MGCGGSKNKYPPFDMGAAFGSDEKSAREAQDTIVKAGKSVLEQLASYRGCEAAIRQAITNPNPETERTALDQLLPCVDVLHEFFQFSKTLEDTLPVLFEPLCADTSVEEIQTHQASCRILGEVFNFALRFDDLKMVNPAIQNDFSYYRRTLNRLKLAKQDSSTNIKVTGEVANRMSLFFAYPTPMMRVLIDVASKFMVSNSKGSKLVTGLGHLANFFATYLTEASGANQSPSENTTKIVAYLTGTIVLYDQISTEGAFKKNSPIMIREAFRGIHHYAQNQALFANAIRFTTSHFNDASTPENIKSLL